MLENIPESPLDSKEIRPVNLKGDQPWIFTWRTGAEAPVFWSSDLKRQFIVKVPDAGKDWGQKEKRESECEMVGRYPDAMIVSLGKCWEMVRDRETWCAAVHGVTKSRTQLGDWKTTHTHTHTSESLCCTKCYQRLTQCCNQIYFIKEKKATSFGVKKRYDVYIMMDCCMCCLRIRINLVNVLGGQSTHSGSVELFLLWERHLNWFCKKKTENKGGEDISESRKILVLKCYGMSRNLTTSHKPLLI